MKFFIIFILFLLPKVYSQELTFEALKNHIDNEVEKIKDEARKQKTESRFYLYLFAARESKLDGNTQNALKFYHEILNGFPDYESNKLEAVINSIGILIAENKKEEAKKIVNKYKEVKFQHVPDEKSLKQYFEALDLIVNNKIPPNEASQKNLAITHYFGHIFNQIEIETMFKEKKFQEALLKMNPDVITDLSIGEKIRYDLLNVLVNKKMAQKFFCEASYKKYPNSYSYSMIICDALVKYRLGKWGAKARKNSLLKLENFFQEFNKTEKYLYDALKELREQNL